MAISKLFLTALFCYILFKNRDRKEVHIFIHFLIYASALFYQAKIVNSFIHLLITSPSLFSPKDRDELNKLIDDTPDDIKALANISLEWLKEHSNLGYLTVTGAMLAPAALILPGLGATAPTFNIQSVPDYKPNKKVLKNAIQQSKNNSDNNQQNTDERKS